VKRWNLLVSAILLAVAGGWVLYTFPPTTTPFYPQCAFKLATGFDCPGCGSTRALHALVHGRFGEAFRFNPMLFAMMIVAGCGVPSMLRGETPRFLYAPWFGWGSVAVLTAWWIGRNVWAA
jgi:hypothetical protein